MDLFDHKNRKILQGVAIGIKMICHWLIQRSMFNIQSMAIHSYVELILSFSNILFFTFQTPNHVDHVGSLTARLH